MNIDIKKKDQKSKIRFQANFNVFHLMRLISKHYIRNGATIFTDFILPIIIMTVLFGVLSKNFANSILPGILLTPIITSSFISFAAAYNEWRSSVILKKIRVSRISIGEFFISFLCFYSFVSVFAFFFGLFYCFLLWELGLESLKDFSKTIKKVNWKLGSIAILQLILICTSGGFLISTLSQRITGVLAIGLTLFLVQAFLLGCYIAVDFVLKKKIIRIFAYFLPFYGPMRVFQYNWFESSGVQEAVGGIDQNGKFFIKQITMAKDWKLFYDHSYFDKGVDSGTLPLNFHDSYWSLFLVGGGWFMFFSGYSIYKNKNLKFA